MTTEKNTHQFPPPTTDTYKKSQPHEQAQLSATTATAHCRSITGIGSMNAPDSNRVDDPTKMKDFDLSSHLVLTYGIHLSRWW
ncbi:hypothetical protein N7471_002126 [Penicillium samsonianum]|uniref:uncharacterized protein n=1 Tax=Penicillium samsonianum TaxID=1882272 RepID=UPI0025475FF7|nr:uncharacterized protein N7471_002126 [Penicillium samsonianum]KAJ6142673.1 hypothetical protein N7471_002126 [Penicillium samsonianum]